MSEKKLICSGYYPLQKSNQYSLHITLNKKQLSRKDKKEGDLIFVEIYEDKS